MWEIIVYFFQVFPARAARGGGHVRGGGGGEAAGQDGGRGGGVVIEMYFPDLYTNKI